MLTIMAKWQKEADGLVGGGWGEPELAALAACIIHVPCSLCVGLGILLALHWDTRPSRLCVLDAGPLTEELRPCEASTHDLYSFCTR